MMLQQLQSIDPSVAWERILDLIKDPSSNLAASLLLLAAVILVLLIIASIIIAAVTSWTSRQQRRRDIEEIQDLRYLLSVLGPGEDQEGALLPPEEEEPVTIVVIERMSLQEWIVWIASGVAVLIILAIALGLTTASASVCVACHETTPHTAAVKAGGTDAHSRVECVSCHESSGWIGSATIEVPQRMAHFLNGVQPKPGPTQYGVVGSAACYRCHKAIVRNTTIDQTRGIRMAHKQPLDAGAGCLDCHSTATGAVSVITVGMSPCLRCHDGKKQSTECSLCHTKDFSTATASHANPADLKGRQLVVTPDCGGCHDQAKTCDPCHGGTRMPHSELFKWWGHARKGAEDIWNNQGKSCSKCHYEGRRPCTKCHAFFPGHPVPAFKVIHTQTKAASACTPCHDRMAYVAGRDFCGLCHGPVKVTQ